LARRAAEPQSRRALTSSAIVGDIQTVGIGAGHPAPPPRHGDRRRHPRPLCGSAPLREKNNAATITARSKSRSPIPPDRSRRAAEPQSAHLKRDRRRHPDRWYRRGTPSTPSASRRSSATPQTSLRLCASAREKQHRDDHRPLEEPIAHPPGQVAQSRRAAERSPQARSSATSRPLASARDTQHPLRVTAIVGDTPDLSAALRLCARQTTPRRSPPARRADRPPPVSNLHDSSPSPILEIRPSIWASRGARRHPDAALCSSSPLRARWCWGDPPCAHASRP
jgi:hypothetical protein